MRRLDVRWSGHGARPLDLFTRCDFILLTRRNLVRALANGIDTRSARLLRRTPTTFVLLTRRPRRWWRSMCRLPPSLGMSLNITHMPNIDRMADDMLERATRRAFRSVPEVVINWLGIRPARAVALEGHALMAHVAVEHVVAVDEAPA